MFKFTVELKIYLIYRLSGVRTREENAGYYSRGEDLVRYQTALNSIEKIEDLGNLEPLDLLQSQFSKPEDPINYLSASTTQYSSPTLPNRVREFNLTGMKILHNGLKLDPTLSQDSSSKPVNLINLAGQSLPETLNLHSSPAQVS